MSFEDFGARLRALRQSRGYKLEDAARHIKLSERTLMSIEEGRQGDLPHIVYAKGFVRTYARFLGMGDEEIAENLAEVFPPEEEDNITPIAVLRQPKKKSAFGTVAILFILAALAVGGWYFYSNIISKNGEQPAAPAVQGNLIHNDEPDLPNSASLANATVSPGTVSETQTAEQAYNGGAASETSNVAPAGSLTGSNNTDVDLDGPIYFESGRSVANNSTGQGQTSVIASGKKHRVVVTAAEECWIKATTDKGDERPFNLPKNQASVFTFDEFLKLRLGNVAGVKIRYDGQDYPIPSGGNTRDLVFPPSVN